MRSKRRALIVVLVAVVGLVVATMGPLAASNHISVELLTPRSGGEFTDEVSLQFRFRSEGERTTVINSRHPSQTVVAKITVQPNGQFPWHSHPGPVLVNVAEGHLTYVEASDCVHHAYPAGTAFVDPGRGHVHTAYAGENGAVLIATFFEIPDTGPLTILHEGFDDACPGL